MPLGPGISDGDELLAELVETGILRKAHERVGPYVATTYALTGQQLPGGPLSDEAVESMLAELLDHAFAVVGERIWTETKLKSEEMLAAVESGLGLVGDQIGEIEKKRILELAGDVRRKIDSHETQQLKESNEALDSATQNLAALIVEKAMTSATGNTRAPTAK